MFSPGEPVLLETEETLKKNFCGSDQEKRWLLETIRSEVIQKITGHRLQAVEHLGEYWNMKENQEYIAVEDLSASKKGGRKVYAVHCLMIRVGD